MQYTIVVSGYFGGDGNKAKVAYLDRLQTYLRSYGFRLCLVNLDKKNVDSQCMHINLSNMPPLASNLKKLVMNSDDLSYQFMVAFAKEAEYKDSDLLSAKEHILRYVKSVARILEQQEACQCVVWNQFTGLHHALSAFCKVMEIPVIYSHLGILPGTIVFERGGQMAESWVYRNNDDFVKLTVNDSDLHNAERYLHYVMENKLTRKPQTEEQTIHNIAHEMHQKRRKLIFYAGQNDYHSGMIPCTLPEARIHSPFFSHTFDALQYLARLADKNNWQILFKPHPNIQHRQESFQGFCSERVISVPGANIFDCLYHSDLVVTVVSQVSYLALIHRRPTLLLGRNQISGKGCLYEISCKDEIEQKIKEIFKEGENPEMRNNWIKHVAQLNKYYLFGFDPEVTDIIGRDVDDAARFLILNSQLPLKLWKHYNFFGPRKVFGANSFNRSIPGQVTRVASRIKRLLSA